MLLFFIYLSSFLGLVRPTDVNNETLHAIYVSVLEVEQPIGKKGGDIRIKVFTNDLEDAIFNKSQERIKLLQNSCDQNKVLVSDYFAAHLQISIDGKPIKYTYVSCEINDASIWFNFNYTAAPAWEEIEIMANYLMELFPTQTNVVSITYHGKKKMFRLLKGEEVEKIVYSD
jgi:hypothetical protein